MSNRSLTENILEINRTMRLLSYKDMFSGIKEKSGSLSATEAFSADVINIMGQPTVTEFANYIGVSQPNATYKVNNLVAKGYIEKFLNENDKRESHLKTGNKFNNYFKENKTALINAEENIKKQFTEEELNTASKVLEALLDSMCKEIKTKDKV